MLLLINPKHDATAVGSLIKSTTSLPGALCVKRFAMEVIPQLYEAAVATVISSWPSLFQLRFSNFQRM